MTRSLFRGAIALLTLATLLSSLALGQTSFARTRYTSPAAPTDVFVADLNGDGKPDIVTNEAFSNVVNVFLNHGNGTFTDQGSAQYVTGESAEGVLVADVNGDGKPDIISKSGSCGPRTGSASIHVLLGNGDGTFQPAITSGVPNSVCLAGLGLIDANGDGKVDVFAGVQPDSFAGSTSPEGIQIMLSNGDGTFSTGPFIVSPAGGVGRSSAADYNGDGRQDIAAVVGDPNTFGAAFTYIFFNNGDGTFTPKQIFHGNGGIADNTVDVNGDGKGDLLEPFADSSTGDIGVRVFLNNGTGTFTETTLKVPSTYKSVVWKASERDLNGDGFHDIILGIGGDPTTSSTTPDALAIFPGQAGNTWGAPQIINLTPNMEVFATAVGDFNADGKTDVALVAANSNSVDVFLNTTNQAPICHAPATAGVALCSPDTGTTNPGAFPISAAANGGPKPITAMKAYIDGKLVASSASGTLTGNGSAAPGIHSINVNAWNSAGTLFTFASHFSVGTPTPPPPPSTCALSGTSPQIHICSPVQGTATGSPVAISASTRWDGKVVTHMTAYVDGVRKCDSTNNQLQCSVAAGIGQHRLNVNAWNSAGQVLTGQIFFTVK